MGLLHVALGKRGWFRIHSFTGIITGLMLFVICWGGTFAVISNELDWLVTPEVRVTPADTRASWGEIVAAVQQAYPAGEVTWLREPLYPQMAAHVLIQLPEQDSVWVYVDPYTAVVQGAWSYANVQRFFRSFHMNLFAPGVYGSYIVMVFAVTLLVSTIAPLYFYKRWWTRFFRFKRGNSQVFWSELHKLVGLWSLWFGFVIAATGLWYLWELNYTQLGGKYSWTGSAEYSVNAIPEATSNPNLPQLPIDELLKIVATQRPDIKISNVWLSDSTLDAEGQTDHWFVRDRANQISLDRRSGEVLYEQNASDYPAYWRLSDTADPLHFGDFGGLTAKIIWFVFGLLLSVLILTGTYLHAQRLAREAGGRGRSRWPGTAAATAVSLLVIAATVPWGISELTEYYGPMVDGIHQFPTLAPGVKTVILAWIAVTLLILATWVFLLWRPEFLSMQQGIRKPSATASSRMQSA